jgi:antitoxin (DNA-binding transcriptional repressor) of toxin-antitoxin stability system
MKMTSIKLSEAKVHLSAWSRRVEAGENIVVLKHNRPAFVMAPLPAGEISHPKKPGLVKGRIRMAKDFDRTPESVIRAFEGVA